MLGCGICIVRDIITGHNTQGKTFTHTAEALHMHKLLEDSAMDRLGLS